MPLRINGESFLPADSTRQRDASDVALDVEGRTAADVRITDLGETAPAGRYRIRSSADKLLIQRQGSVLADGEYLWPSAITLMEFSKDEVAFKVPLDLSGLNPFVGSIIDVVDADVPDVVWLGDGNGPTHEPDGYLMVGVAEDSVGFVPYWRGSH